MIPREILLENIAINHYWSASKKPKKHTKKPIEMWRSDDCTSGNLLDS